MDAYDHYVAEHNGVPPENVFQLLNFSRSSVTIPALSYNKALIIFQKHNTANKMPSKKRKRNRSSKPTQSTKPGPSTKPNGSSKREHSNGSQLSLSTTTPTSPRDQPSSLSIEDDEIQYGYNNAAKSPSISTVEGKMKVLKTPSSDSMAIRKSKTVPDELPSAIYKVGDEVVLSKDRDGIIRFIGSTHFTKGTVYGIQLSDRCTGKHDGAIDGVRYFQVRSRRYIRSLIQ